MIEAKRKEGESTAAFLRRFTKKIQLSGVLMRARRTRFKTEKKTRRQKQLSAVRRAQLLKERERLFKLGKLNEWGEQK